MSDMPVVKQEMRKSMTGVGEKITKPIENKDSVVTSKFNSIEPVPPSQTTSNVARQCVEEVVNKADVNPTSNEATQYVSAPEVEDKAKEINNSI
jgi:hypothetical protein